MRVPNSQAPVAAASLLLPLALVLLLGTLRGGVTSLAKYVSMLGIPPLGYTFWQSLVAALLLIVVCLASRRPLPVTRAHLRYFAICGAIGMALPNSLFFAVVKHIPAGSMAVILVTIPLLTYAMALLLRMEPVDGRRALGIGLGLSGAVLVVMPGGSLPAGGSTPWLLLGFLCPLLYAAVSVFATRQRVAGADPLAQAAGTLTAAALLLLPAALLTGTLHPIWQGPTVVTALILAHGAIAATAYALFFILLRVAGPVYYSQSAYVIAVTGIGFGMLVFDERHPGGFWLAVLLIFAGLLLVNLRQRVVAAAP